MDTFNLIDQCRICLEPTKLQGISLSLTMSNGTTVAETVTQITQLRVVVTDDFSQIICQPCFEQLKICIEFKDKAWRSDQLMRTNGIQVKEEFDDNFMDMVETLPQITVDLIELKDEHRNNQPSSTSTKNTITKTKYSPTKVLSPKRKRTKSKFPILKCCMCGAGNFKNDNDLIQHVAKQHPLGAPQERQITSKHVFQCQLCKRKYWKKKYLAEHFATPDYVEPKRVHQSTNTEKKKVMCSDCGKLFACKTDLEVHIANVHTDIRDVECEICGRVFSHEKCLNRHKFRVHSNIIYTCDICGREFRDKTLLKSHVLVHVEQKRFKCPHCPKSFSLKYAMENHVVVDHTEVKRPHTCDQCMKSYRWLSDLKKHIRADHLGKPPCSCLYCGRGFTSSSSKNYHQKRCQFNPVPFNNSNNLIKMEHTVDPNGAVLNQFNQI